MSPEMGRYTQQDANADIAAHAADLDAHTMNWYELLRIGEYIRPFPITSHAGEVLAAGDFYAVPFLVARSITVDRITIEVTAGAALQFIRLGIYNDGTNLYPGTLLLDAGTVDVAAIGMKAITINQALTKGLYWLVLLSQGTPTVNGSQPAWTPIGQDSTNFNTGRGNSAWLLGGVAWGALPDPFPAGAGLKQGNVSTIMCRLLSLD